MQEYAKELSLFMLDIKKNMTEEDKFSNFLLVLLSEA